LARKSLQFAFIAVGACEIMKVFIDIGIETIYLTNMNQR
jgi:hypothetical protein